MRNYKNIFANFSLPTYSRLGPLFVKGRGSWLWDSQGRKYLDLFPGWGVSILGHSHPRIAKVLGEQARRLVHLPNNLFSAEQALLAREISKRSFPSKVFFGNSGAEAIEGAIKFSRLYGQNKRFEIITFKNSFHGRTFGALSATAQKKYKECFRPLLPGFREAEFNDFGSFKRTLSKKTVAVLLELIQGEGGVNVADKNYVRQLRKYCFNKNILFIVDEVQTGMGRTGKLFCYQNYGVVPDIMVLSKGLGAGVPISALVVRKKIASIIKPGMHASTFGGSPLVSRAALEVFKILEEEKILKNVAKLGKHMRDRAASLAKNTPVIKEIKGEGMMLGLELDIPSYPVFLKALGKGLIVNSTHDNILRVMPALNSTVKDIDKGFNILEDILSAF
ncbi:MAG: acetylornithine/succinylornithine family transaminase [Candidatus Omnitrophica bacterium]|nr:acetylornithine/succinylornithine family transaminase [Candidatus Omnitrophota bacterium]MBD3269308.1 acetylornithine/succinylornithine family transaminase [Candidatus Omnitrophota bacterium]